MWPFTVGGATAPGTQIDFILDRGDNCINLLELKFHNTPFELTKEYAHQLREKVAVFKQQTHTRKNVFITLLTVYGVKRNEHFLETVAQELTLEVLFD